MTLAICSSAADAAGTARQLDIVLRELDALLGQVDDAALGARALPAATDWHADAALAFHAEADTWARDVAALAEVADAVRDQTRRARDRAALAAWSWCG